MGTSSDRHDQASTSRLSRQRRALQRAKAQRKSGAEPGLDASAAFFDEGEDEEPDDIRITVSDFNSTMYRSSVQNLESFSAWLNEERPAWSSVRWIHCPNLSLGFLKACALKYDLHNLAVEDCLHSGHVRAKADYYLQHLFLSLPIQTVRPVLSIPADNTLYELGKDVESGVHASTDSLTRIPDAQMATIKAAIRSVTEESHIGIQTDVLCVFLLKDGTVISMTRDHDSTHLLKPIFERLASKGTILRESEDPSMLLQALLDLIVDHLLDIGDAFERQLTILEGKVMVNPDTDAVRDLHILSAELSTLRRSLKPLQTVIYNLRNYDGQKAATIFKLSSLAAGMPHPGQFSHPPSPGLTGMHMLEDSGGFLTPQSKVYLSDASRRSTGEALLIFKQVHDHLEELYAVTEQFDDTCQNLISYTFNMVNFQMQESMNGLSLVTVILLPASVMTGYFGMNFQRFNELQRSVTYFWACVLPVVFASMLLFGWSYFASLWEKVKRLVKKNRSARQVKYLRRKLL